MGLFGKKVYDKNGFNKEGIHKDTRTRFNKEGFNKEGFGANGLDKFGFDKNGFNKEGFDKKGYDKNGFNKEGIHTKTGTRFNKEGFDKDGIAKDELTARLFEADLKMIAFKGEQKFVTLISGGNFDFYDSESPAYILQVKLNGIDKKIQTTLLQSIRNAHHFKPTVFTSKSSIGAYWQTDLIEEEIAKSILLKIIRNYNQFYT